MGFEAILKIILAIHLSSILLLNDKKEHYVSSKESRVDNKQINKCCLLFSGAAIYWWSRSRNFR